MTTSHFGAPVRAQNPQADVSAQLETRASRRAAALAAATPASSVQPSSTTSKTGKTFRRRIGTLAVAASVAAAGLVAAPAAMGSQGSSASAAVSTPAKAVVAKKSVKKTKAQLSVSYSDKSWAKGSTPGTVSVSVKTQGKAASGTIKIYSGSKRVKTLTLKNGKASYTFNKKLSQRTHKMRVVYYPTGLSKKTALTTTSKTVKIKVTAAPVKASAKAGKIVAEAKKYVGVRYTYGGTKPSTGFDCSGFTSYVFKKAGVANLPRSSSAQKNVGTKVSKANAKPGDLVWTPGHVAIYLGNNKIIDAPRPGKTIQVRTMWQDNPTFIRV